MNVSIPTLADAAGLCYVRVSIWSARKLDKKQTQKSLAAANATNDGGRFNKHLLANADAKLKEVQRKGNQIRDYVEANTWTPDEREKYDRYFTKREKLAAEDRANIEAWVRQLDGAD